jgi:molybdopterin-synthase adenylyltransferase
VTKLIFQGNSFIDLSSQLLVSSIESCAIILATSINTLQDEHLLVSEIIVVPDDFYSIRTSSLSEIKPDFLVSIVKRARSAQQSVVFCHTHPNTHIKPAFSHIDDEGEKALCTFMKERVPNITHAALVIGNGGCMARKLGSQEEIDVIQTGAYRRVISSSRVPVHKMSENHDRQVRAFGKEGQSIIEQLRIGIVGLGGTGSFVSNQLAYLGGSDFILIDPDDIELTNLNRLVGSTAADVESPKVEVAKRNIYSINNKANVRSIKGDVTYENVAKELISCDFIFCCTDSHASRAVINQIAYQYYIPSIDMGVSISTKDGAVSHITGRVQMLSPGLGCLVCGNVLDGNAIRREMMNEEQKKADPYFNSSIGEPEPAVISLNGTMSSLAITMFLGAVTNIPAKARLQYYDGIKGVLRSVIQSQNPSCIVCSKNGALGLGHQGNLPTRRAKS